MPEPLGLFARRGEGDLGTLDVALDKRSSINFFFAARTDIGRRREENQDAYGYEHLANCSMFIVADGMGGARGGATASAIAVDVITQYAANEQGEITEDSLRSAIIRANNVIYAEGRKKEDLAGMGTTVVVVVLSAQQLLLAHVGDSRIYRLRDNKLELLTRDHTLVKELIDSGAISPEQAENHPIAHMLTRSLGPTPAVEVESRALPDLAKPGDRFLLCSDGLYNLVKEDELTKLLAERDLEKAAKLLINRANEGGGTDNITAELIEVRRVPEAGETVNVQAGVPKRFVSREVGYEINYDIVIQPPEATAVEFSKNESESEGSYETEGADVVKKKHSEQIPSVTNGEIRQRVASEPDTKKPILERKKEQSPNIIVELKEEQVVRSEDRGGSEKFKRLTAVLSVVVVLLVLGIGFILTESWLSRKQKPLHAAHKRVWTSTTDEELRAAREAEILASTELAVGKAEKKEPTLPNEKEPQASPEENTTMLPPFSAPPSAEPTLPPSSPTPTLEHWPEELRSLAQTELFEPSITVLSEQGDAEEKVLSADLSRVIAEASDLDVPPPPALEEIVSEQANQPINWEAEREARNRERSAEEKSSPQHGIKILTAEEKENKIREKIVVRGKISDIDTRLNLFSLRSPSLRNEKETELQARIAEVDHATEQTQQTMESLNRRYQVWQERKNLARSGDPVKLANEVSLSSVQVKKKKESYDMASLRYLDAVELWRENPNDDTLATQMSALGRELKTRRAELKSEVENAIDETLKQVVFDVSEFSIMISNLERHRTRLNRYIGFVKGYIEPTPQERLELQRQLFEEREKLMTQLRELRLDVSDQAEIELRRDKIYKQLGFVP